MKICVIGASRGIGRRAVDYALSRGHTVHALSRNASGAWEGDVEGLRCFDGDATNPADLEAAVDNCDAVLLTLGVPRDWRVLKPTVLFSTATQALIPVMQQHGVHRLLAVTGFGAGSSYAKLSSLEKVALKAVLGRAYADKGLQEELIVGSALDWTIARPGILTDNAMSKRYRILVEPDTWRQGLIGRADVAHFMVTAAEDGTFIRQTPALQR
jgi:putative NADH-flavin reductase